MEDADRASSVAPGAAPHEESGNEASAAGQTRADEPLLNAEESRDEQVTEVNTAAQTPEVTGPKQVTGSTPITEETSLTQTPEVTNVSPEQVNEITSPEQVTGSTPITEETSLTQTPEVTNVSPEQVTEITSSTPISEETSLAQISEEVTEQTSVPPVSGPPPPPPPSPPPPAAAPPPDRIPAPRTARPTEPRGEPHSEPPPAEEPEVSVSVFQTLPSDRCRSLVASTGFTMDAFEQQHSVTSDPDLLSPSDDDLTLEMKSSVGVEEVRSVSDSPSPDLLQDAYEELQTPGALSAAAPPNLEQQPVALPDILQSSPLNPEKLDSGSSEGSPDCSPAHRCSPNPPNPPLSTASSPDSRILLLREMVEETEARAAERAQQEVQLEAPAQLEMQVQQEVQSCTVLDLLQEAPEHTQTLPLQLQTEALAEQLKGLQYSSRPPVELWDSSPSADSFSPVLDAELQKHTLCTENTHSNTHSDAADEEQEPSSSEEFEFVERPVAGAAEEFVELQDGLSSITAPPSEAAEPAGKKQSSARVLRPAEGGVATDGEESDIQQISPTGPTAGAPANPTAVLQLLYWHDVRASALVLGSLLLLLLFLSCCSVISVFSYSALCLLTLTLSTRVFMGVLQAVRKTEEGHPFRQYLERDMLLSADAVHTHSEALLQHINTALVELRRLFLVEDLVDSLKLAVCLWLLTYVGSWFNGLTLLIIALIGAFSSPIAYKRHQSQIDQFISTINTQIKEALGKVQAMVPGGKKKSD